MKALCRVGDRYGSCDTLVRAALGTVYCHKYHPRILAKHLKDVDLWQPGSIRR